MDNLEGDIIHRLKDAKTTGRLVFFATEKPDSDDATIVKPEDLPDWVKQSDILTRLVDGELVAAHIPSSGRDPGDFGYFVSEVWIGAVKIDGTLENWDEFLRDA